MACLVPPRVPPGSSFSSSSSRATLPGASAEAFAQPWRSRSAQASRGATLTSRVSSANSTPRRAIRFREMADAGDLKRPRRPRRSSGRAAPPPARRGRPAARRATPTSSTRPARRGPVPRDDGPTESGGLFRCAAGTSLRPPGVRLPSRLPGHASGTDRVSATSGRRLWWWLPARTFTFLLKSATRPCFAWSRRTSSSSAPLLHRDHLWGPARKRLRSLKAALRLGRRSFRRVRGWRRRRGGCGRDRRQPHGSDLFGRARRACRIRSPRRQLLADVRTSSRAGHAMRGLS